MSMQSLDHIFIFSENYDWDYSERE